MGMQESEQAIDSDSSQVIRYCRPEPKEKVKKMEEAELRMTKGVGFRH